MAATDDYQKVIELVRRSENGGEEAALLECALDNVLLSFTSREANSVTSEAKDEMTSSPACRGAKRSPPTRH